MAKCKRTYVLGKHFFGGKSKGNSWYIRYICIFIIWIDLENISVCINMTPLRLTDQHQICENKHYAGYTVRLLVYSQTNLAEVSWYDLGLPLEQEHQHPRTWVKLNTRWT